MVSLKRSCTSQMNKAVPGPSSVEPTSLPRLLLAIADVEMACDDLLSHPQHGMSHVASGLLRDSRGRVVVGMKASPAGAWRSLALRMHSPGCQSGARD